MREQLDKGADFAAIHAKWPSISKEDLALFKDREELASRKALRVWGKELREKNIGPHNLGSRGYAGKEKIWEKEDAKREGPNPYDKIKDPLARRFIRSHYKENPKVPGDFVLNSKVKDRKSTRLNASHSGESRMPSSA